MAPLTFREAGEADLPVIVALLADDIMGQSREVVSDPLDPRYWAAFAAIQADANQMLAVAEREGRVVGCLQLSFVPSVSHLGAWRGQIEGVRVAQEARSFGVGRAMMDWAIGQCRARGCVLVQLTTNRLRTDAQRFYVGLGFEASHVGMKLDLS